MWQWIAQQHPGWSALILLIGGCAACKMISELFLPLVFNPKQKPRPLEYVLVLFSEWFLPITAILLVRNWLLQHLVFSGIACFYLLLGAIFTFWHRFVTKKFSFSWITLPSCIAFWPWFACWGMFIDEMQKHDGILIDPVKHDLHFFDIAPNESTIN